MGLKSIFDGLYVDQLIRKNEHGDFVIYPSGLMGRGYLLPAEREPVMRKRLRTLMLVSLVVSISYAIFLTRIAGSANAVSTLGWVIIIGLGVLLLAAIFAFQRQLARGLEPVPGPRLTVGEWLRRGRRSRPTWTYWFGVICGLILALLSAVAIGVGVSDRDLLVIASGIILLAVSLLALWDGALGLKERSTAT